MCVVTMNSAKETLQETNVAQRSDGVHGTFSTELNLVRPSVLVSLLLVGSWGNVSQMRPTGGTWSVRWDIRPGQ